MKKYIHCFVKENHSVSNFEQKCINSWIKKLSNNFEVKYWTIEDLNNFNDNFAKKIYSLGIYEVRKKFLELYVLYNYGGLYIDTNLELVANIDDLFKDCNTLLGVDERNNINPSIWYESKPRSYLTTKLYKKYKENFEKGKCNSYYLDMSLLLEECIEDFDPTKQCIQNLDNNIRICSYDYFYPYSFDGHTKNKTNNTRVLNYFHYDYITPKGKLKNLIYSITGETIATMFFKLFKYLKNIMNYILKPLINYKHHKTKNTKEHQVLVKSALKKIDGYHDKYYVVFHNPEFTGVSNATIELFENCIPCGELISKSEIKMIADALIKNNIKEVVFSGFCIGWASLAKLLYKNNIICKTYFHGSHSQYGDVYGWKMNKQIFELERKHIVEEMAFCKKSIIGFYKDKGCNVTFLRNLVNINYKIKKVKHSNDIFRVGVYAVQTTNWKKNVFSSLGAVALMKNVLNKKIVVDIVPKSNIANDFMQILGIDTDGIETAIKREKLLERMSKCDINLYVTYTECAPMLPLESFYVGVPCLTGNNHHYFHDSKLENYLVVDNENNPEDIREKIIKCIDNKDKVMELYTEFKDNNLIEGKKLVKKYLNIKGERNEK